MKPRATISFPARRCHHESFCIGIRQATVNVPMMKNHWIA